MTEPDVRDIESATRFRLVHLSSCESTQDVALGSEGCVCVWADEQTSGRGRQGRSWHGKPGEDVELTFRIEGLRIERPEVLAAAVPTAMLLALESLVAGEHLNLKWPNDVIYRGRKLAGILIDGVGDDCFVVGVGVNVNRVDFPAELRETATSLALAAGRSFHREDVVRRLAMAVDRLIHQIDAKRIVGYESFFRARLRGVGREVRVVDPSGERRVVLTDVDFRHARFDDGREVPLGSLSALDLP